MFQTNKRDPNSEPAVPERAQYTSTTSTMANFAHMPIGRC